MSRRDWCLLCNVPLEALDDFPGYQKHPAVSDCTVRFTDAWGIAVDEPKPPEADKPIDDFGLNLYPAMDHALMTIFDTLGLDRLGGISSGRGWSSFSLYQRCPYAWKRRHIERVQPWISVESPSLAIGTLVHAFLALYYTGMMEDSPYAALTPTMLYDRVVRIANPEYVAESMRVFKAYALWYKGEEIVPLAIEYDLRDPRNNESCRFDMIAFHPTAHGERRSGTYDYEHKTASRFDHDTLTAWSGDGEILGQVALWDRLGLDHRFGPLAGVVVNLLGKHKEPLFHRTLVSPTTFQIESHLQDLKRWEGLIQLSRSNGIYPRARANCVHRYGRCDHWDHCAGED